MVVEALAERFSGKVVVVTGAASGIGRSTALRFLAEGAKVVVADLNEAGLEETAKLAGARASEAVVMKLDVAEEADHLRLRRTVMKDLGRFDVMVNAAGISGSLDEIIHCRVQDWDRTVAVLMRGVFLGIKHAALAMMRQPEGGAIVNISSVAALCGSGGGFAYSAAKAGVVSLTQTSSVELARSKIRVNAICPGWILTPMVVLGDPDEVRRLAPKSQPLATCGEPEDIAGIVAFLASNDARFVTGATITADGGALAEGPGFYTSGNNPLGNHVSGHFKSHRMRHADAPVETPKEP